MFEFLLRQCEPAVKRCKRFGMQSREHWQSHKTVTRTVFIVAASCAVAGRKRTQDVLTTQALTSLRGIGFYDIGVIFVFFEVNPAPHVCPSEFTHEFSWTIVVALLDTCDVWLVHRYRSRFTRYLLGKKKKETRPTVLKTQSRKISRLRSFSSLDVEKITIPSRIHSTNKHKAETLRPVLEFDNLKTRLKSCIFKCISFWLNGLFFFFFWLIDDRGFWKRESRLI